VDLIYLALLSLMAAALDGINLAIYIVPIKRAVKQRHLLVIAQLV
jgi:hypothetical protein